MAVWPALSSDAPWRRRLGFVGIGRDSGHRGRRSAKATRHGSMPPRGRSANCSTSSTLRVRSATVRSATVRNPVANERRNSASTAAPASRSRRQHTSAMTRPGHQPRRGAPEPNRPTLNARKPHDFLRSSTDDIPVLGHSQPEESKLRSGGRIRRNRVGSGGASGRGISGRSVRGCRVCLPRATGSSLEPSRRLPVARSRGHLGVRMLSRRLVAEH